VFHLVDMSVFHGASFINDFNTQSPFNKSLVINCKL
jgi:hypothetical protein